MPASVNECELKEHSSDTLTQIRKSVSRGKCSVKTMTSSKATMAHKHRRLQAFLRGHHIALFTRGHLI